MKKKAENKCLNESCFIMNFQNPLNAVELLHNKTKNVSEDHKISLQNSLTPSQTVGLNSTNNNIKLEKDALTVGGNDNGETCNERSSPPLTTLGPGAEIKGKICHPIPSGSSKPGELDSADELCRTVPAGTSGGRLTFFKEGKLLLELSHRSDQGSWVQVKSKTYWPPPSTTTTTTTIQHPLRHDTPNNHSAASDDCSSMNSSPWSSDHIRKQIRPNIRNKLLHSTDDSFYIRVSPFIRSIRKRVRLRRNPYSKRVGPTLLNGLEFNSSETNSVNEDIKYSERKKRLERSVKLLREKCSIKLDCNVSIRTLFEKLDSYTSESVDPTFISPRKRYLRALESDLDSHSRKKVHSGGGNSISHYNKHCDRPSSSSPSFHIPNKSAINSQNSSPYSIDSLLSSESESKKGDSFLRTLLKPENKHRTSHSKASGLRERGVDVSNHLKAERGGSPYRKESNIEQKKCFSDRFEMNQELSRFTTASPSLSSLYLNPYFDPRYMVLHSLSAAPSFLPAVSQPSDMASAVAAAVAGYPLNPLHISALTGSPLLPGALTNSYAPTTSLASHLIRSPTPTRSSPLSVPHTPSPKPSPAPPPLPLSPHLGMLSSPRDRLWTSSPLHMSPHKPPSTSSISPPPQDVPLNLSKPKGKS